MLINSGNKFMLIELGIINSLAPSCCQSCLFICFNRNISCNIMIVVIHNRIYYNYNNIKF